MTSLLPINITDEKIIKDYDTKGYCIIEYWLIDNESSFLFSELSRLYDADCFRKTAIGKKLNETIESFISSDLIWWIDASQYAKPFFTKIYNFIEYLNKTCFDGIIAKKFNYAFYTKDSFYKKSFRYFSKRC